MVELSPASATRLVPSPALVIPLVVSASAVKALLVEFVTSAPPVSLVSPILVAKCATATDAEQLTRASSASSSPASVSAWRASADDSAIAAFPDSMTSPTARNASAMGTRTSVTL